MAQHTTESGPAARRPFGRAFAHPTKPRSLSPARRRIYQILMALCLVAGPIAVVIAPLPVQAIMVLALFGGLIGVLYLTDMLLLQAFGMFLFVFVTDTVTTFARMRVRVGNRAGMVPWWEGVCIVTSAWALILYGPSLWRRIVQPRFLRKQVP